MESEDLDELFERWNTALLSWLIEQLRRRGASFEDARDAIQEAFTKEYRRRRNGAKPPKSEKGLLLTMAWQAFVAEREKQTRESDRREILSRCGMLRSFDDPKSEADRSELQEAVAAARTCLTLEESNVIDFRFGRAWSISEIAQCLGISPRIVKARLAEGIEKLRSVLITAGIDGER
jgi:RNA polymerase sigma factor (sigma-70 family)